MHPPSENHCDCGSGRVREAADWSRLNRETCPHPVVPYLTIIFGLNGPKEAIEALRLAPLGGTDGTS
jgi:hypothetical protein